LINRWTLKCEWWKYFDRSSLWNIRL